MKAIIQNSYGSPDLLKLEEIPKPTPEDNEVLVKICASSVNFGNKAMMLGKPFMIKIFSGFTRPKDRIPGWDMAGIVEAVGKNVKNFKPGDEVYTDMSLHGCGSYAEYICTPEEILVSKPKNITFEEAAAVPVAAITALQALHYKGNIEPGQEVLINGASGGVGSFAMLIALAMGAEVTAVCSTKNQELMKERGAHHVIDYTKEDFTKSEKQYDVIIGANGNHSLSEYKRSLKEGGRYVCSGGSGKQIAQSMLLGSFYSMGSSKTLCNMGVAKINRTDMQFLSELLESGKLKPIIDKTFTLEKTADALKHFAKGHISGKIVIKIS